MKKGVSLITLIITIIIMVILASVIILSVTDTDIINKSKNVVNYTNVKGEMSKLELFHSEQMIDNGGAYNPNLVNSDSNGDILHNGTLLKKSDDTAYNLSDIFVINGIIIVNGKISTDPSNILLAEIIEDVLSGNVNFNIVGGGLLTGGSTGGSISGDTSGDTGGDTGGDSGGTVEDIELTKINNLGKTGADNFNSVIKVSDGYVAVGSSDGTLQGLTGGSGNTGYNDFVVAKFDNNLDLVKINNFGGTGYDIFYDIIQVSDGYVACGYTSSSLTLLTGGIGLTKFYDFVVAKLDNNLDLVEMNNFDSGMTHYSNNSFDCVEQLTSIVQIDNGYIVVGNMDYYPGFNRNYDREMYIAKLDTQFNLEISKVLTEVEYDGYLTDLIEIDTGYVACGYSKENLSTIGGYQTNGETDFVIIKFDNALNISTVNNIGGTSFDKLYSLKEISSGGYVAVGYSMSDLDHLTGGFETEGNYDCVIAKFNDSLYLEKITNFGGSSIDYLHDVVEVSDGYVAVGESSSDLNHLTDGSQNAGDSDYVIAKFNSNLDLQKITNGGGILKDGFNSIVKSTNGYVAVGLSASDLSNLTGGEPNEGSNDFIIAEFGDEIE